MLIRVYNAIVLKTIFHGSNKIIEKPLLGCGKVRNDYGLGFYCTEDLNMAKERGDLYIVQILDEEIKPDDLRLR